MDDFSDQFLSEPDPFSRPDEEIELRNIREQGQVAFVFPSEENAQKFIESIKSTMVPTQEIQVTLKDSEEEKEFAHKVGTGIIANGVISSVRQYLEHQGISPYPQERVERMEEMFGQGGVLVEVATQNIGINQFQHITTLSSNLDGGIITKPPR